jgi:hypothetical protein
LNKLGDVVDRKKQRGHRVVHSSATTVMAGCINADFVFVLSSLDWSVMMLGSDIKRILPPFVSTV